METLLAIINEPKKAKSFIGYVARLSLDLHTNIHLMYVQEPYDYTMGQPPVSGLATSLKAQEINAEDAKKEFDIHIRNVLREISGDVLINYSAEINFRTTIINSFISENKASMVILEEEEQNNFWSQTPSVFDIINHVDCPVWIIPFNADYKPFRKIVYATDYKEEDIDTLKNLIRLTYRFSPVITALHITDSVDFEEKVKKTGFNEMLQTKTSYQNITVKSMVEKDNESTAELINEYALKIKADLIVVLRENRSFFERILSPDSTKKILKEAQLPVLVYQYR